MESTHDPQHRPAGSGRLQNLWQVQCWACPVLVASRRDAKLTQAELAARLGKPPSYIAKIEIGERRLDVVEFTAIAKALKIDPRILFERYLNW